MHRDIKPQNLMLDKDKKLKLIDFGLSRNLVMNQSLAGTGGYIAPEILMGKKYTNKCDVWSIGCVVFEICCGYPPFIECFDQ